MKFFISVYEAGGRDSSGTLSSFPSSTTPKETFSKSSAKTWSCCSKTDTVSSIHRTLVWDWADSRVISWQFHHLYRLHKPSLRWTLMVVFTNLVFLCVLQLRRWHHWVRTGTGPVWSVRSATRHSQQAHMQRWDTSNTDSVECLVFFNYVNRA